MSSTSAISPEEMSLLLDAAGNAGSSINPVPLQTAGSPNTPTKILDAQLGGPVYSVQLPNNLQGPPNTPTQSTGKVNWLNSSYSGTDITIVAHLYQDISDAAKQEASDNLAIAQAVVQGANSVQFALPNSAGTSGNPAKIFAGCCFPNGASDRVTLQALNILQTNLAGFTGGVLAGNAQATGQFIVAAQTLFNLYSATVTELTGQNQISSANGAAASSVLELGQCQTFSVQSHRDKTPVRSLGRVFPNGYVRGQRTIAGSIIFTVFDEHPLSRLVRAMVSAPGGPNLFSELTYNDYSSVMIDQLPPIDLTIVFANEYGSFSRMGVYGVEFVNDGMTMSIEDILLENVVQFTAMDVDIMTSVGMMKLSQASRSLYNKSGQKVSGSDLFYSNYSAYNSYCTQQLGLSAAMTGGNKTGGTNQ